MNDTSLLPLGYERCLEELSGFTPKIGIFFSPNKVMVRLCLGVGGYRPSHNEFMKYVDRLVI